MKFLLSAFFVVFVSSVAGQTTDADSTTKKTASNGQIKRTDSFAFGSRTFPIPRDCNSENQSNCCSYLSNPDQLSCGNGTVLEWYFVSTEEVAKENADVWTDKGDRKSVIRKEITCYLLDKEVKGWQTNVVNNDGHSFSVLYIWSTMDGKGVLVKLISQNEIKQNNDITQVYRQIIRLKS